MRRRTLLISALSLLAVWSCRSGPRLPPEALHDLTSLAQFTDAFNRDAARPRLLLLLSPT